MDDDGGQDDAASPTALDERPAVGLPSVDIPSDELISSTQTTSSMPEDANAAPLHPNLLTLNPFPDCPPHPLFTIEQLGVDRRLLVNRKRQLKMYRVWMQGKFRKVP